MKVSPLIRVLAINYYSKHQTVFHEYSLWTRNQSNIFCNNSKRDLLNSVYLLIQLNTFLPLFTFNAFLRAFKNKHLKLLLKIRLFIFIIILRNLKELQTNELAECIVACIGWIKICHGVFYMNNVYDNLYESVVLSAYLQLDRKSLRKITLMGQSSNQPDLGLEKAPTLDPWTILGDWHN